MKRSNRKRNFIIYHFLVESKPHERIDLLITASMNIYQTKKEKSIPIVMKVCFSEEKLIKQFRLPPFPPISEQFFHDSLLCPNYKNKNLPVLLGGRGRRKLCGKYWFLFKFAPGLYSEKICVLSWFWQD